MRGVALPASIAILVDDQATLSVQEDESARAPGVTGPKFEHTYEVKGTALWNPKSYVEFPVPLPPGRKYNLKLDYANTANLTQTYNGQVDVDGVSVYVCLLPMNMLVDANRDGKINDSDWGIVTDENPWDFWLNDNDDTHVDTRESQRPDWMHDTVQGAKDLDDYFPVFLDIQQCVKALPPMRFPASQSVRYKLKQSDGAVNIVETHLSRDKAFNYLKDSETGGFSGYGYELTGRSVHAIKTNITPAGAYLSESFLRGIRDNNEGVILVEGCKPTTNPLVLVVEKGGVPIAEISLPLSLSPRVLLLLHGMNSNTDTWNEYVLDAFGSVGNCIDILDEEFRPILPVTFPSFIKRVPGPIRKGGVRCYRVQFGFFETKNTATKGLEDLTVATATGGVEGKTESYLFTPSLKCGDFESFDELAREVDDAIAMILTRHPSAKIVLAGHSRGGLIGRKFLQGYSKDGQSVSSENRKHVVGFLTTSSLHKGSPMGRIYEWLAMDNHKRGAPGSSDDWEAVDFLREPKAWHLFKKPPLDARRPVINDMSDRSDAVRNLNDPAQVANLPSKVVYGEIIYSKVNLGILSLGDVKGYSAFDDTTYDIGEQFSKAAEEYILGAGNTPASFPGDGLIPKDNQHFTGLPGIPAPGYPPAPAPATGQNTILRRIVTDVDVVHTDAPKRVDDLKSQLRLIAPNWFP